MGLCLAHSVWGGGNKLCKENDKVLLEIEVQAKTFPEANKMARAELRQELERTANKRKLDIAKYDQALEAMWREMIKNVYSFKEKPKKRFVITFWISENKWNSLFPRKDAVLPNIAAKLNSDFFTSGCNCYALIIGNSKYCDLPALQSVDYDTRQLSDILSELYGYKTAVLTDAGKDKILQAIDMFRKFLREKDQFILYYGGHGYLDTEIDQGYWIPIDTESGTSSDWISNADITGQLKMIKAKNILVISGSCFSGTSDRKIPENAESSGLYSRMALTSGGLEPVPNGGDEKLSVFCKVFYKFLKENEGEINAGDIAEKIIPEVKSELSQTPCYRSIRKCGHQSGGGFRLKRVKQ